MRTTGAARPEHGTYGAYQIHNKRSEEPCSACKSAAAAYMRNFRATRTEAREADRWWVRTRSAALQRLADEYPERMAELVREERECDPGPYNRHIGAPPGVDDVKRAVPGQLGDSLMPIRPAGRP